MKTFPWTVVASAWILVLPAMGVALAEEPPPRAKVVQAEFVELRYELPNQEEAKGQSTAARWGLAAPMEGKLSDPNRIIYDQAYIEKYVNWAVTTPIADGGADYFVVTPQGERKISTGLDAAYLGTRFAADDLVKFLKTRTAGKRVEKTFRVANADAVKVLRENPESLAAKRLYESPWDQDTRNVVYLFGLAQYAPAYPHLVALAKEAHTSVRYEAIMALGRLAPRVPAALDDLEKLLGDKNARSTAADALSMAGEAAAPVLSRGVDHPDWTTRNQMVHSLGRYDQQGAIVAVMKKVLNHADSETREWGAGVLADLTQRAGPEAGKPYVAELAKRLKEDSNSKTRYSAVLALLNMKAAAAPAEAALRHAAERKDEETSTQRFAREALEELKRAGKPKP